MKTNTINITSQELERMGWFHVASASDGGTKEYCNRNSRNPEDRNKLPMFIIEYHGDNFIFQRDGNPKLNEIMIKFLTIDESISKGKEIVWHTLYSGSPKNALEVKSIIDLFVNNRVLNLYDTKMCKLFGKTKPKVDRNDIKVGKNFQFAGDRFQVRNVKDIDGEFVYIKTYGPGEGGLEYIAHYSWLKPNESPIWDDNNKLRPESR